MAADEVGAIACIAVRGRVRQRHFRLRRRATERGHTVDPADSVALETQDLEAAVAHVSREAGSGSSE